MYIKILKGIAFEVSLEILSSSSVFSLFEVVLHWSKCAASHSSSQTFDVLLGLSAVVEEADTWPYLNNWANQTCLLEFTSFFKNFISGWFYFSTFLCQVFYCRVFIWYTLYIYISYTFARLHFILIRSTMVTKKNSGLIFL